MPIPTITSNRIILRNAKESDIDDRFAIGIHHEFTHMCGGPSMPKPEYPNRDAWVKWYDWYIKSKDAELSWIIDFEGHCIGTAGFHHISQEDKSATYKIGIFDVCHHSKGIGA